MEVQELYQVLSEPSGEGRDPVEVYRVGALEVDMDMDVKSEVSDVFKSEFERISLNTWRISRFVVTKKLTFSPM